MGLTRCRKSSVIFWELLRNTIKMGWNILAFGTKTVCASTSSMLACLSTCLLNANLFLFPQSTNLKPNNVLSSTKNQCGKSMTNSCKQSKALSSFTEVHNVLTSKPTDAWSASTRTNITTQQPS